MRSAPSRRHIKLGQRLADSLARGAGSWPFILGQTVLWGAWIGVNLTLPVRRWDPYPFILLNLALSFQAAYAAPIIMMSQNRQARRDRDLARRAFRLERRMARELDAIEHKLQELEVLMSGGPLPQGPGGSARMPDEADGEQTVQH
ncbi:MAG: DUF1003 domain-containing protein [Clostridia bacterium]